MSEEPTVLGSLSRTRPHRRSEKRGAPAGARKPAEAAPEPRAAKSRAAKPVSKPKAAAKPTAAAPRRPARRKPAKAASDAPLRQPAQPSGIPAARRAHKRKPAPVTGAEIVGTAVQAVGELAELGLALSARALRNATARLPRP
jgi:hypothetical protein